MFRILFLLFFVINENTFGFLENELSKQLIEGEKQLTQIKANANLPQYGRCWTHAIQQIDSTCAQLTDTSQAALAMKFTRCFIEMSGGDSTFDLNACEPSDVDCMRRLPERIFQAYTHFYTHTQNTCFYLMHQLWHAETEKTIDLLRTHSQSVSKQLEIAGRLQINLLQQQREGLTIQRQLVEHGHNLSQSLHESRGNLIKLTEEFRNSTIEHGQFLGDLFKRIAQLHNWFVGEYLLIEQIVYFIALSVAIGIFTSSKRTENCRLILYLMVMMNVMIEWSIQRQFDRQQFGDEAELVLFNRLWIVRKIVAIVILTIYVVFSISYVDQQEISLKLLREIHKQNNEILRILRQNRTNDETIVNETTPRKVMRNSSIDMSPSIGMRMRSSMRVIERAKQL